MERKAVAGLLEPQLCALKSITTILSFALAVQSVTDNDADFSLFQTDENKSSSALGKSHSTLAEESV